jgi:hypothetical protein
MKKIILLFILITNYAFSQSVNDYQSVIVPIKFDFLKSDDQYKLNTLTKLLLQKYGFKVYFSSEEIPSNVDNQRCNFLYADVINDSGILMTKLKVALKDCRGQLLFETQFGSSREKNFAAGYNQALRDAGKSFDKLDYKYNGKNSNITQETPLTNQIETKPTSNSVLPESSELFYFAQPTSNGFQVVNNEPKVILRLFNTSQKNVFIAEIDTLKGIVIFKNGQWFFEYYENGKLISESWNLKF